MTGDALTGDSWISSDPTILTTQTNTDGSGTATATGNIGVATVTGTGTLPDGTVVVGTLAISVGLTAAVEAIVTPGTPVHV